MKGLSISTPRRDVSTRAAVSNCMAVSAPPFSRASNTADATVSSTTMPAVSICRTIWAYNQQRRLRRPLHDHTNQGQMFSYLAYPLGDSARVSLITGTSVNFFQIPPNPDATPGFELVGVPNYPPNRVAESELEQNYFGILTLDGTVGTKLDYRAAYFS